MGTRVGIVIPALNPDPARLVRTTELLVEHLGPAAVRIEVDCPNQVTAAALAQLSARMSAVSINVADRRRGKGAAIAAGFDAVATETDVVAFVDADGATDVEAVAALIGTAVRTHQLVVGSRHHPEATIDRQQHPLRRLMGRMFVALAGRVVPIRLSDYQCGAKALPSAVWLQLRSAVIGDGFGFDIWLITAAIDQDIGVRELPITWTDRSGTTVAPVATVVELLGALIAIARRPR